MLRACRQPTPGGSPQTGEPHRFPPAAEEPRLVEASPPINTSRTITHNEPSFSELAERFDALLLEGAELLGITRAELSSGADTSESVDELLQAAFDAFGLEVDAYTAEQSLLGLNLNEPTASKAMPAAPATTDACRDYATRHSDGDVSHESVGRTGAEPAKTATWLGDLDDPLWRGSVEGATGMIQALVRGCLVRRGIAEARALYAFGASPPRNACLRRIHGGPRLITFAFCARGALAIPFNLKEVLAISSHSSTESPGLAASVVAMELGNRQPADASRHREGLERIKGAAARKAAKGAASAKLQAAREAALEACTRVTEVGGELYFLCSEALGAVEEQRRMAEDHRRAAWRRRSRSRCRCWSA